MSELDDLIAKNKASEQRERDATDARVEEAKSGYEFVCSGCGRRWFTTLMGRPKPPVWIPEADRYYHLICWRRKQEGYQRWD